MVIRFHVTHHNRGLYFVFLSSFVWPYVLQNFIYFLIFYLLLFFFWSLSIISALFSFFSFLQSYPIAHFFSLHAFVMKCICNPVLIFACLLFVIVGFTSKILA